VSVGYEPDRPIIEDLSLTITGPERVAIVGSNGSGKTTVLALVTGQVRPWTGTVRVMTDFAVFDRHRQVSR
jgi:ABC-type bacteriocin/lantibiotic exporter with double-glycine peptidase domain